MKEEKKALVSVCVITYNHAAFIARSLQGILDQVTNFDFDIVIGEDASTDETRSICEIFLAKYPGRIKLLPEGPNKGVQQNLKNVLEHCSNKYIAVCEGDDYWIDEHKLQKQVDFLEGNTDYSLSCTRYIECDTKTGTTTPDNLEDVFPAGSKGIVITKETLFNRWLTKTCTVVFRSAAFQPGLINRYRHFRDNHLFYHILQHGKGFCMNDVTCQYNKHEAGMWSFIAEEKKIEGLLIVFEELYKQNKNDLYIAKIYSNQLQQKIDHKMTGSSPFFSIDFHAAVFKYAFHKRSIGVLLLQYVTLFRHSKQ